MRDSYVPNLRVPPPRRPSSLMWATVVLCIILPPIGLLLLWGKVRCPLRGKLWISILSVTVMVVMLTFYLQWQARNAYVVPQVPVAYHYGETGAQEQPGMGQGVIPQQGTNAYPVDGQAPATDQQPADVVMPANPMG